MSKLHPVFEPILQSIAPPKTKDPELPEVNLTDGSVGCYTRYCNNSSAVEVVVNTLVFRLCGDCQKHLAEQLSSIKR